MKYSFLKRKIEKVPFIKPKPKAKKALKKYKLSESLISFFDKNKDIFRLSIIAKKSGINPNNFYQIIEGKQELQKHKIGEVNEFMLKLKAKLNEIEF